MDPRLRRLQGDFQYLTQVFANHPHIRVLETLGNPPEKYLVEFLVPGLVADGEDAFHPGKAHQAEIFLPLDYPRRPPFCRMLTPLFHPNVDPQKICIGDHWSAGQKLADLIVRIAEMITYQTYNLKSPLNAKAAVWAQANLERLPLAQVNWSVNI